MTRAEGKELLDRIYREVQKVRSNLIESRTGGADDWEKRVGPYDEDYILCTIAPRLFGQRSVMKQLTDVSLDPEFTPLDIYSLLVLIFDDKVLKTHLMMFSSLKRRLPSLSGWSDELSGHAS